MSTEMTELRTRIHSVDEGFNERVNPDELRVPALPSPGAISVANGTLVAAPLLGVVVTAISITLAAVGMLGLLGALALSTGGIALLAIGFAAAIYAYASAPEKAQRHNEIAALKRNYQIMEEQLDEQFEERDRVAHASRSYARQFFEYMLTYC